MMNCPICQTHKNLKNPIFENENWIVREADKNLSGYLYLESKVHLETWLDLNLSAWENLGRAQFAAAQILSSKGLSKLYMVAIAEQVPHLHLHFVPRYEGQKKGLDHLGEALGSGFFLKE
ncbi:HIT family hydrolase [Leptospira sp. 96542]|nr:HIT family hydrolase [Leptospira sp. 96542]